MSEKTGKRKQQAEKPIIANIVTEDLIKKTGRKSHED